jgi:cell division septation protein DedD
MIWLLKRSLRKASNGPRKRHYTIPRHIKKQPPKPMLVAKETKLKELVVVAAAQHKAPSQISKLGAALPAPGPYHIQIGAFRSETDALARLSDIGTIAGSLLKGHKSFTMQVPENNVYRARFAGFTEYQARRACSQLKKKAIDCLAVPAK